MQSLPPERPRPLRADCPNFRGWLSGGLVVTLVLCSHMARADETLWVSVLAGRPLSSGAAGTLDRFAVELESATGIHLLSPAQTAAAFEHQHSQPAMILSPAELQTVDLAVRNAMQRAAVGEWRQAEAQLAPFSSLAPAARDYAVWRLDLTQDLFDLCTMRAGWLLNSGHVEAAQSQLARCIVEAPAHPGNPEYLAPELRPLYDQARDAIFAEGHATLQIVIEEDAPAVDACQVLINGNARPLSDGTRDELPAGLLLRVAVHCGDLGRVHDVTLHPGDNRLTVDPALEQVVLSGDVMALRSHGNSVPPEQRHAYVRAIARILTAGAALLTSAHAPGQLALERVLPNDGEATRVVLHEGASTDEIRAAARILTNPKAADPAAGPSKRGAVPHRASWLPPGPRAPATEQALSADSSLPWPLIAGATAAATGIAGFVLASLYLDLALQYRDPIARGKAQYLPDYDTARGRALLLGVAGAALVTSSVPLLLPAYEEAPYISWIAGGIGAAAATLGTYVAISGQTCATHACAANPTDATIGTLVLLGSLPLLSVPLTYLVRALLKEQADVQVRAQLRSVSLNFSSNF